MNHIVSSSEALLAHSVNELIRATTDSDIIAAAIRAVCPISHVDLGFQHFEHELVSLPGAYSPPRGALFLVRAGGSAVGCIGRRPFSDSVGEIKRLYVVPAFRGHGLARSLVSSAIAAAKIIGYSALVLDTLSSMRSAIAIDIATI